MNIRTYSSIVILFTAFISLSLQVSSNDGSTSPSHQASVNPSESSHSPKRSPEHAIGISPSVKGSHIDTASKAPAGPSKGTKRTPSAHPQVSTKRVKERFAEETKFNPYTDGYQTKIIKYTAPKHDVSLDKFNKAKKEARQKAKDDYKRRLRSSDPDQYRRQRGY
ncbi:uncharacterized protein FA14DRAFT_174210 [Meira miltonrushii]|uniref:Uncharacterized protein n=1 Tax=Meira miltonrushii TaxID=1280837 RepID=A0A316V4L1_9BASI|nr:uncharacterized protein FA14DRAFT_174210 [Meira miltonrushii]PWN32486.1 hypothetical protein FA14DRAFT_174210 [Meira miltonrushii]